MSYRNIIVTKDVSITVNHNQIHFGSSDLVVPMEDINSIVIENPQVKISSGTMQRLCENDCIIYICDNKHLPATVVLPIAKHSRHYKMLMEQVNMSKPSKKRLWQQVVKQKISNQAMCLRLCGNRNCEVLDRMVKNVQSGDKTNMEAQAAMIYFRSLFGEDFTRGEENGINAALNYGYSIIRGQIARSVVCYGFEPALGINHHSQLNNFNLVDDFIEPYRPFVDYYVISKLNMTRDKELQKEDRYQLVDMVNYDMMVKGERHVIHHMIDKMIASYNSCILGNKSEMILPELIELNRHSYE